MDFKKASADIVSMMAASNVLDHSTELAGSDADWSGDCLATEALERGWVPVPDGMPAGRCEYKCFRAPARLPLVVVFKACDTDDGGRVHDVDSVYACHGALVIHKQGGRSAISVCGGDFMCPPPNEDVVAGEFESKRWSPRKEYAPSLAPVVLDAYRALVML